MQFSTIAPEYDETNIPDNLAPIMDTNIDWLHILKTPEELIHRDFTYISEPKEANPIFNWVTQNVDADILNREQIIPCNILSNHILHGPEEPVFIIVTGGGWTGKRTVTKYMCDKVNVKFEQ